MGGENVNARLDSPENPIHLKGESLLPSRSDFSSLISEFGIQESEFRIRNAKFKIRNCEVAWK